MLLLYLSFTGTIVVGARMSFTIVLLILRTGVSILDLLLPGYYVEVGKPRIDRFGACFFPYSYTGNLWKSLRPSVFIFSYNLPSFKSQVYKQL